MTRTQMGIAFGMCALRHAAKLGWPMEETLDVARWLLSSTQWRTPR